MHDGVLVIDFNGCFVFANRAALDLFLLGEQEIREKTYSELFMSEKENDAFNDILFGGIQNRETQVYREVSFRRRDGKRLELAVTTSFLRNEDQAEEGEGIVVVFKDITESKALDRARRRVLDHISHELSTPLAIIKATLKWAVSPEKEALRERMEHNLNRLQEIQTAVADIVHDGTIQDNAHPGVWVRQVEDLLDIVAEGHEEYAPALSAVKKEFSQWFGGHYSCARSVDLSEEVGKGVEDARARAGHRRVSIRASIENGLKVWIDPGVLRKSLMTLIKNAIEATPDGGTIDVSLFLVDGRPVFEVRDTGVGITPESQVQIFGGFYHALETDLYTTKKPFDFGAGGKGLELLRLRVFAEVYRFTVEFESKRCIHIPAEHDLCPGSLASCPHAANATTCAKAGGSVFRLVFRDEESL